MSQHYYNNYKGYGHGHSHSEQYLARIPSTHSSGRAQAQAAAGELMRKHSERHQVMKIQNYVIYRKTIGAGSMGKVKLAECLTDVHKQKYAVKIMPKIDLNSANHIYEKTKDPKDTPEEREQRTIREMAIMRLLRHPNICQLKEYITEGDKYYMFLEYIDGGQLLDYIIKHGRLKEKQARKFARQIVSALDYCHRNSIVHRDLKIENILITQSEQLKIIDFGLSNVYSPTQQLNTFCGSLYFAAPELLRARQYTGPEVDVWSFGVVLYVLVCGKVPFDDTNLPALHEKIKSGIIESYPDYLGKDCLDLLTKIFVVDPKQRITISGIKAHPWMNKGYEEPIRNYLPRRQPLETIDMDIVKGMDGFGLGTPEEIVEKLSRIITSPEYRAAAIKIERNYQKSDEQHQQQLNTPKWRRSLSATSRSNYYTKKTLQQQQQDDFRSLPAMYDPLVSIYYLVKERKESEERKQQLLNPGFSSTAAHLSGPRGASGGLNRSASTVVRSSRHHYLGHQHQQQQQQQRQQQDQQQPLQQNQIEGVGIATTLKRRRTYDVSKKKRLSPEQSPVIRVLDELNAPGSPIPTIKRMSATTLIRKKSLQAARKMGLKLPNSDPSNSSSSSSSATVQKQQQQATQKGDRHNIENENENNTVLKSNSTNSIITSPLPQVRSNWIKVKQIQQLQPASPPPVVQQQQQQQTSTQRKGPWRKLSFSRPIHNRLSAGNLVKHQQRQSFKEEYDDNSPPSSEEMLPRQQSANTNPHKLIKPSKSENSLPRKFNFNHHELFRTTPDYLMNHLLPQLLTHRFQVELLSTTWHKFSIDCIYPYAIWSSTLTSAVAVTSANNNSKHSLLNNTKMKKDVRFQVTVYEARWAGGKLGIKLKYQDTAYKQIMDHLYHGLLNEINNSIKKAAAQSSSLFTSSLIIS
ncbi:kinase-like domain-containing protein [Mycotypha africana]|uniref:kinase-like domain-containing protein n=1 Tax=Mycotypha africana TaxID=64632 RepID=UPI0023011D69|nr:kinase-like domain-containing protein [Mycotypha africana]KAI8968257.1 kinase-like domain-containing protein [Mycotypha africana]